MWICQGSSWQHLHQPCVAGQVSFDTLHKLVLLCVDVHCFIFWDLPGDVLAAPELALCGSIAIGVILFSPLLLSFSLLWTALTCGDHPLISRAG